VKTASVKRASWEQGGVEKPKFHRLPDLLLCSSRGCARLKEALGHHILDLETPTSAASGKSGSQGLAATVRSHITNHYVVI
jgi:hypothetical protein